MKLRKVKIAWMMIVGLVASFSLAAQQDSIHRFSVQQAVDYATKNNVQVKNALLDVLIQKQTNKGITSAAFPQVNGSFSLVDNVKVPITLVPAEFFGGTPGTFEKFPFGIKYNATAGLSLDQLLFDGQVFVGLQARKTSIDFMEKNVDVTSEVIKANVYKVYYQLAASKSQIEIIDANIERLQKTLFNTTEMYKNGFVERLDIDKINVQLANIQTQKLQVQNMIRNGFLGLKLLMGMPTKDSLILTDTVTYADISKDLLDMGEFKYSDRKEYQYAELGIRLNEYNIKRYKLSRIPTVSLNAYYNENAQRNKFDFFKGGEWFPISAITLRVNVPIFHGFAIQSQIDKAKLELQKSINMREALKISIDNSVDSARNNFRAAISILDNQKKNMDLATEVYNQTRKKYEAGTGSQLEISNAQADLTVAQQNYISAMYDAIIARVDYLKAIGKL